MFDVDRYRARIGVEPPPAADLATLRRWQARHAATVPFENVEPFLGRPVDVDADAVAAKLVDQRRGGYCFEQNTLFGAALAGAGFTVTPLAARVLLGAPAGGGVSPRTHMLLRVDLEGGRWIADVGFGGHLMNAPLALDDDGEQPQAGSRLRVRRDADAYVIERVDPGPPAPLYRFTLEPQAPADFRVANWYTSTFPGALMRNHLLVERVDDRERVSLFDRRVTRRRHGEAPVESTLASAAQLEAFLRDDAGIDGDDVVGPLWERLQRL
ncbi:MAG: arylamine N-acetyltransferase [Proteobacteria bacterium]|nr:arylamine N-acetyltransferase [Pseudomonadota bacterium]